MRDFGGWLREHHTSRQLANPALRRLLGDIEERELWRAVIIDSESTRDFLEPNGAARIARRAWRVMAEYGIPHDALGEYGTDEALALLGWSRRFEERCRELNCVAAAALAAPERVEAGGLAWVESPMWRPMARRWLETRGALRLTPSGRAAPAAVRRVRADSPGTELAEAADWARAARSVPDARVWVCIPDAARRRAEIDDAFDAALAPQRFSMSEHPPAAAYAVAGGAPLATFGPVRAALDSLRASVGTLPFEAFSALLRMPDLQASDGEAMACARLDLDLRRCSPSEAPIAEWLRLADSDGKPVPAVQRLTACVRTLAGSRGALPISRWVTLWVDAFEAGPWALRHRWSSTEFQAAERLRELLAALASADAVFGPRTHAAAAGILERAARDTPFQPQTGITPIWVTSQIQDPWLQYDGLWVAGCSDDRWPPPVDPIPLLPVRLQREYGVVAADVDAQLALAGELQRRWSQRAAHCTFSCSDAGDGRATAFSPLLPPEAADSPMGSPTRPHWRRLNAEAPPRERLIDEAAPPFAAGERTRGVATIAAQSRCAFRGFAETRLGIERLNKPQPGFSPRERGEMVHWALEFIWAELRSSARLVALEPGSRAGLVYESAAHALRRQLLRRDPGGSWQRRELPRLARLLDKWLDAEQQREPFEIEELESATQTALLGGVEFRVRIDRVDRLADGSRVLIDYKTGGVLIDWRGDRPENPQLPMYALLRPAALVAVAYGRVNAGDCSFQAEADRDGIFKPRSQRTSLEGMANFPALIALWSARLETIASEFASGHAAVTPIAGACRKCFLQPLCRITAAGADEAPDAP